MRVLILASALGLAACSGAGGGSDRISTVSGCHTRAYDEIGGPIDLINQDGEAVTQEDFKGEPSLVFFGFTYCPDICPMTLVTLDRALSELPEDKAPRTVLISVDPERDTPETLKTYIGNDAFPDRIVGLTGSDEQVAAAAGAFVAAYAKVEDPSSAAGYTMDHSSIIYLMDEDWNLKTFFTHEATATDISTCLQSLL